MSSSALRRLPARGQHTAVRRASLRRLLPPIERREFWAVQALVLAIAAAHTWVEYQHVLDEHSAIYLLPTTLYLIPIVYAAVNFGLRGAVLTAIWSALLVVPNIILWHQGLEKAGEIIQVAWITVAAVFVGSRVDRVRVARLEAERREAARRASEERYRAIVDNVTEPIILLDDQERVIEANESAAQLVGSNPASLRGRQLDGSVGNRIIEAVRSVMADPDPTRALGLGEPLRWYVLTTTRLDDPSGLARLQVVLLDVTASYERERGLESITRQTLVAREEERRRIARDLHDGPLQSLIQLWRSLDKIAAETPAPDNAHLLAARDTTEDVASELRRFSRDLRPSILDDLGVVPAIRMELEAANQRSGIRTSMRTTGDPVRADPTIELTLLRIAQEALRNIERHSRAENVAFSVAYTPDGIRLVVIDDGIGIATMPTPSQLLAEGHLGLIGIQERARMVGGSASFEASASGGLAVTVRLPRASSATM